MVGPNQASANFWVDTRVKESSEQNKNLTLEPALPVSVSVGDIAWITNLNSRGFTRDIYIDTINNVIQEGFPNSVLPITADLDGVVNLDSPYFTVPDQFSHIYGVEALGIEGTLPWTIPASIQNIPGYPGWAYDYSQGKLVIAGYPAQAAVGQSLRLLGYGKGGLLVSPGDTTTLNRSYLIKRAAEQMNLQLNDQKKLAVSSMHKNSADELMVSAVTMFEPNTIRIR